MPLLEALPRNAIKYGFLNYGHGKQGLDLVVFATSNAVDAFETFAGSVEREGLPCAEMRVRIAAFCKSREDVYVYDLCDDCPEAVGRPAVMLRLMAPRADS